MFKSIDFLDRMRQELLDPSCIAHLYRYGMNIPEWIKKARAHAKLTQTELGERIGRTKGNVSAWEKGLHEPSYSQMLQIADLTGFPLIASDLGGLNMPLIPAGRYQKLTPEGKAFVQAKALAAIEQWEDAQTPDFGNPAAA